jgi:hypothetical protein
MSDDKQDQPQVVAGKIIEALIHGKLLGTKGPETDHVKDAAEGFKTVYAAVYQSMHPSE